jgi:hypothetical protein
MARAEQLKRLVEHMVAGRLLPSDVGRLLKGFDTGWKDGLNRPVGQHPVFHGRSPFQRFPTSIRAHKVLSGRFWQARRLRVQAAQMVRDGNIVTMYLLSLTSAFHKVRFTTDGVWCQCGGQFGKSDRTDPYFRFWRARRRVAIEQERVAPVRVPKGST